MEKSYSKFLEMLSSTPLERKAIIYKRKIKYEIQTPRLNELVKRYFDGFDGNLTEKTITIENSDMEDILFLLRYHFRMWIEVKDASLTIFKNFPSQFKIIKEVNKSNHPFTPQTFKVGTIMYFNDSSYGTANWLNGIPLAISLTPVEGTSIIPTTQINYDFIQQQLGI